jgi:hypothetical protein
MHLFPVDGGHNLFTGMYLSVLKGLLNGTGDAYFVAMFVDLVTFTTEVTAEIVSESSIDVHNVEIPVLDGNVAGYLLEYLSIALLSHLKLAGAMHDIGDIGGHLHDPGYLSRLIFDGRGVNDNRRLFSVQAGNLFQAVVGFTIPKGLVYGAYFAFVGPLLVHLVTVPAFPVPEVIGKLPVCIDNA